MTIFPAESTFLSQTVDDWPYRACAQSFVAFVTDEGYSAKSIRSTIRTITAFIEWKKDHRHGDPTQLTYDDPDRFTEYAAATGSGCIRCGSILR